MPKHQRFFYPLLFLGTFAAFWLAARKSLDPDFGWHLQFGLFALKHGIPLTDQFSYTMPHYPIVDHEWLTDITMASVFPIVGIEGLVLFFSFLATSAVLIQVVFTKSKWFLLPFLLTVSTFFFFLGIKPQIISWFFMSLLLLLLLYEPLWQKFKLGLPLLFLVWVNLHGGFTLGLLLLGISIVVRTIQQKKLFLTDIFIFLFSIGATLINPYQHRMWYEVWSIATDTSLRWNIKEWGPAFSMPLYGFIILFPLSVLLILRYRKKFTALELTLFSVLLLLGLSSARLVVFWLLIAIPITTKAIAFLYKEIHKNAYNKVKFQLLHKGLVICFGSIVVLHTFWNIYLNQFSPFYHYPEKAVAYLKQRPYQGNLFSEFDWGGYLGWQYPEKKVFVDGRMPSWRTNGSVQGDSINAYADFLKIIRGEPETETLIRKYNITTILIKKEDDTELVEFGEKLLTRKLPYPKRQRLQELLEKRGMKVVYQDQQAVIYQSKL